MISRAEVDALACGDTMQTLVDTYFQGKKPEDVPLASPLYGDFADITHVWDLFTPYLPPATKTKDRMDEYVRAHSGCIDADSSG